MKILLLNDNPVVNKLVTLSAQKTSDDLEVVANTDEISESSYDLLVIDDTVYTPELLGELQEKITFSKSLYICSRDAQEDNNFTKTIKKPFLPTDLVELFSALGKEVNEIDLSAAEPEEVSEESTSEEIEDLDLEADMGEIEELSFEDEADLDLDIPDLGELEDLDSLEDTEDISLDDELSLGDDEQLDGILDKDELQEVQDLLDETDDLEEELDLGSDDLDLDDDLDLEMGISDLSEETNVESLNEAKEDAEVDELEELSFEDDTDLEEELDLESDADLEEELDLESEDLDDALEELSDETTTELDETEELGEETDLGLDLESEIENAVSELSQEDLESEIDEDTLLDIVSSEIDNIDLLNARDLQVAIGEEVTAEAPKAEVESSIEDEDAMSIDESEEPSLEVKDDDIANLSDIEIEPNNEGVESLKKLLAALSNEDIAASMKGMKISINIELGDNK